MKKSLFSRYFYLCASIVLTSIAVLGVMLVALSASYFRRENLETLERKAAQAAQIVSFNYALNNYQFVDSQAVTQSFSILSMAAEADIFLADATGKIILCSDTGENSCKNLVVDRQVISRALTEEGYQGVTRLDGIYDESYYVAGVAVTSNGTAIAAVFSATSASGMSMFLKDVFRMFFMGAVLVVLIAFVVVFFSTEALVRPLRAMLKATDSFARGDFSVRVPVEGDEEIEQLAMAFNNMAASLATQEVAGRSFIANVSHELKTPMTIIGGFIDGILDGTIPPEKYSHYLGIVSQEVKRLSRMVVSMLNISRIEAGEMHLRPQTVDLHEIVCRTVLGFEPSIEEKRIKIQGLDAEKMLVEADPDLAHQIVYNLIENAVKFTPEEGTISLSYENDGRMLRVAVRNTGDGIPKEEIPRLFDRFYKSDRSRSGDKKGVGLGLHIVKSLVHLHGGSVNVKSVVGEYAEFSFTLPLSAQKSSQALFRKSEKSK